MYGSYSAVFLGCVGFHCDQLIIWVRGAMVWSYILEREQISCVLSQEQIYRVLVFWKWVQVYFRRFSFWNVQTGLVSSWPLVTLIWGVFMIIVRKAGVQ